MRHRTDANTTEIVGALEAIGCTVFKVGRPVDLLCGYRAKNFLLEIKNKQGLNQLTEFQKKWIPAWKGQVRIVYSAEEAIEVVTKSYGGECLHEWSVEGDDYGTCLKCGAQAGNYKPLFSTTK